jgi:transposase InsO family protein
MTDNASEFRSHEFEEAITKLGATHGFIRAGRPQSNGCVERVQRTLLWNQALTAFRPSRFEIYITTPATTTKSATIHHAESHEPPMVSE